MGNAVETLQRVIKPKPKFLENPISPIEEVFEIDGITHYQFVDPMATPGLRGLNAVMFYEELRMRTSYELQVKEMNFISAKCDELLNVTLSGTTGKIDLVKAIEAIQEIKKTQVYRKERMDFIVEPELAYKFASVVFFDENESPYSYDPIYNKKKIERWKKHESTLDFFLRQPIARLIGFMQPSELSFQDYMTVIDQILKKHSDHSSLKFRRATGNGQGVN